MRPSGLLLGIVLALAANAGIAQDYPRRPITLVVPFAPGGSLDTTARRIMAKLSPRLGQQIVVDNRAGAGGSIGAAAAARAAPDGYTLLFVSGSWTTTPAVYKNLSYDPVTSFAPIIQTNRGPFVLAVQAGMPVKNVKDLVQYARENAGKLNYGSAGIGSIHHLGSEILKRVLDVELVHVPYKGVGPAYAALAAGEIHVMFDSLPGVGPSLQSGHARAIAVAGAQRLPSLPNVPTLQEQGIRGADVDAWFGVVAPAGTPRQIVTRLHAELTEVLRDAELVDAFMKLGFEPAAGTSEQFAALIASDAARYRDSAAKAGVRAE